MYDRITCCVCGAPCTTHPTHCDWHFWRSELTGLGFVLVVAAAIVLLASCGPEVVGTTRQGIDVARDGAELDVALVSAGIDGALDALAREPRYADDRGALAAAVDRILVIAKPSPLVIHGRWYDGYTWPSTGEVWIGVRGPRIDAWTVAHEFVHVLDLVVEDVGDVDHVRCSHFEAGCRDDRALEHEAADVVGATLATEELGI